MLGSHYENRKDKGKCEKEKSIKEHKHITNTNKKSQSKDDLDKQIEHKKV